LKIGLVIERFEPGGGGVEAIAWTVAHALEAAGDEVHVVARQASDSSRLAVHRVRVSAAWQPLRVLHFSRAAAAHTRLLGCDVVHSFSRTRHQDVFRAGGGSHAEYLLRSYGRWARRWRRISPRHAVLLGIERRVFADPRQVIQCNSAMVERELAARYRIPPERRVVIPNGVDLERFRPNRDAAGARMRADLGVGHRGVWLLAGSGLRRKGLDTALRALAQGGPPDAELWVAGRDDPRPWQRLAEDLGVGGRVRFLGPRGDMQIVYAAADALILPTRYDAFANVCLEAAASGVPVVTTPRNGAAEALGDGTRVIEDPADAEGFAAALDELADPATRDAMGRAARRRAEAFSWDAHVAALRALYARVAR
jgi:UDP-glucose:(heptosyl)LPS alpha-1,3-glucosyltransferase